MKSILIQTCWLILISLLLTGCGLMRPQSETDATKLASNAIDNQNRQVDHAIALLQQGETHQATRIIEEVLLLNPEHQTASLIDAQLKQPIEKLFGTKKTFTYTVVEGDSLGKIAKQWLTDPIYFVSLTRLNQLKNPAHLAPGTRLKIPLTEQANQSIKQARRSKANLELVGQYLLQKNYWTGLQKANKLFMLDSELPALFLQQQKILKAIEDNLNRSAEPSNTNYQQRIDQTQQIINRLQTLQQSARNPQQAKLYVNSIQRIQPNLLLAEAQQLFVQTEYLKSARKLAEVKTNLADGQSLTADIQTMESELINKLHEQAIVNYRGHALKEALDLWNAILQLNSEHVLAIKYHSRTKKLLNKLDQY